MEGGGDGAPILRNLFLNYISHRVLPVVPVAAAAAVVEDGSSRLGPRNEDDDDLGRGMKRVSVMIGKEVFLFALAKTEEESERCLTFRDLLDETFGPTFLLPEASENNNDDESPRASLEFVLVDLQGRVFMLNSSVSQVLASRAVSGGTHSSESDVLRLVYRADSSNVNSEVRVNGEEEVALFKPLLIESEYMFSPEERPMSFLGHGGDSYQFMAIDEPLLAEQQEHNPPTMEQIEENLKALNQKRKTNQDASDRSSSNYYGFRSNFDLELALELNRRERKREGTRRRRTVFAAKQKLKQHTEEGILPNDTGVELGSLIRTKSKTGSRKSRGMFAPQKHELIRNAFKDTHVWNSVFRAVWAIILAGVAISATLLWEDNDGIYQFRNDLDYTLNGQRSSFTNTQLNRFRLQDVMLRTDFQLYMQGGLPSALFFFTSQGHVSFLLGKGGGAVRIRQLRVNSQTSCTPFINDPSDAPCYPSYTSGLGSRASFGNCGATFPFTQSASSKTSPDFTTYLSPEVDPGGFRTYYDDAGGYFQFAYGNQSLTNTLANIFAQCWIDEGTRAVITEYNMYNVNSDLFAAVKLIFEFEVTGDINTAVSIRLFRGFKPLSLDSEKLAAAILSILLFCGVVFRVTWTLFITVRRNSHEVSYYENASQNLPWLIPDILVGSFFAAAVINHIMWYADQQRLFTLSTAVDANADYVELYDYGRQVEISRILLGYGCGLAVLGLFRVGYLCSSGNLLLLTLESVSSSLAILATFMILPYFLITASVGFINANIAEFQTYGLSFTTMIGYPTPSIEASLMLQDQYIAYLDLLLVLAILYKLLISGIFSSRIITEFSQVANEQILASMGTDIDDIDTDTRFGDNANIYSGTRVEDAGLMHAFRVMKRW